MTDPTHPADPAKMTEREYRELVEKVFRKLEKAFDAIDPDLAELEVSQGAATIQFSDRSKCILSQQPSVRQIWLANAARGIAHHFDYNRSSERWLDDKGKGVELGEFLRGLLKDTVGVELKL